MQQAGDREQIGHPEGGAARREHHGRIRRHQAGPPCGDRAQLPVRVMEEDALVAKTMVVGDDRKLLPAQGMEGMSDAELFRPHRALRCN